MAMLAFLRQLRPALCQASFLQPAVHQGLASGPQQLTSLQPAPWRGISASLAARGLEDFFDTPGKDGQAPTAGTSTHNPCQLGTIAMRVHHWDVLQLLPRMRCLSLRMLQIAYVGCV